ncbi:HAMP domain-containing histidine kinase [Micromonospora sp. NBC_01655]|uniref:sensor histidine kinase n=1 Tax=Micromonospora sp. NBC_01655 TaxID=2975983 RepID=UPI002250C2DD|nr:HAMP domain-containing sensor histidine kinase [Micromonospora sp. NBC_01655]MCX4471350.1 HAMP domain-containing histidine kinase [Micromonospora sp. NBC_01655]
MSRRATWRGWWERLSFRGQLVAMISVAFVIGGGVLLVAQYVVLSVLLSQRTTTLHEEAIGNGTLSGGSEATGKPGVLVESHGPAWMSEPAVSAVLGGVQLWSAVLLLMFAALAVGGAWLVSRRALRRIAEVTAVTNAITEKDLSRRLDVQGPDDEIRRLGGAIDGMVERLEAAFVRQAAFIANASHEFRTPLTTTRTVLQVALRQGRVPGELRPEIEDVLDANARLEALVAALLIIAQGRAAAELPRATIDIAALCAEITGDQADAAAQRGVAVESALPPAPVMVTGNKALLRSMIANLLANAIRHGDGALVKVTVAASSDRARVRVENTGAQLSPEVVARLTEPFERGDRSRVHDDGAHAGTGLGLTLVDSVAALHEGSLHLMPRDGGGLIAELDLPTA